ncbi:MAG: hypothetical protein Q7V63_04730 [Gammaproteobacteria bacterium]|nr:hypothetical protein [Gammaproteobacteria bacterium]
MLSFPSSSSVIAVRNDVMIGSGAVSNILRQEVESPVVLSAEDEAKIVDVKDLLSDLLTELSRRHEMCLVMLRRKQEGVEEPITVKFALTGEIRELGLASTYEQYRNKRQEILDRIKFLASKASKLYCAKQLIRANVEMKIALDYITQAYGPNHTETLKIQLEYAMIYYELDFREGPTLLIETVKKLELDLKENSLDTELNNALAKGDYRLAQYYLRIDNIDLATAHLNRSEFLRRKYVTNTAELKNGLDKIDFMRGMIASKQDLPEAEGILMKCYEFRKAIDPVNAGLIPVLEVLINLMDRKENLIGELNFVREILYLQKYYQVNKRQIIKTQLLILELTISNVSSDEFWTLLYEVEGQLEAISVTEESLDIGQCYLQLAKTRMNILFPDDWSRTRTHEYCMNTLVLIGKAESHLHHSIRSVALTYEQLHSLKEKCIHMISYWENPRQPLKSMPTFPEDEAAILAAESSKKLASGGLTKEELEKLSDFSSEARQSLISIMDRLLTVEAYEALPVEGSINPYRLRVAQGGITSRFNDGKLLDETKARLTSDPSYTKSIPPIEIGIHDGKVYSFDTRRLIVHQQAREDNLAVLVRYRKISGAYLESRIASIHSPRPWNGIVTALRYGGKGSESTPYINPLFRHQLEKKVERDFKPFPSERIGADDNGFPVKQKEARKIFDFLTQKAGLGSTWAAAKLVEANGISHTYGKGLEFYEFLIQVKKDASEMHLHASPVRVLGRGIDSPAFAGAGVGRAPSPE